MKKQKKNFFLDYQEDLDKSKVVILPIPFERTTSYLKGTSRGPQAIINASCEVEFYDEELDIETYRIGIHTLKPLNCKGNPSKVLARITETVTELLMKKKFPVAIGGEHTITPFIVKAFSKFFQDLSVLTIDAHADLRSEYQGTPLSHACASYMTRRIASTVLVGIRAYSKDEAELIKKERIKAYPAHGIRKNKNWIQSILKDLKSHVYLSVDMDGLDPCVIPAVGTPVPGGLDWWQTLDLIKTVAERKKIVGLDFVELCPSTESVHSDFITARLIYKTIGYIFSRVLK